MLSMLFLRPRDENTRRRAKVVVVVSMTALEKNKNETGDVGVAHTEN